MPLSRLYYGFDLAAAHRDRLPETLARLDFRGARALPRRMIEDVLRDLPELVGAVGKMRVRHRKSARRIGMCE